MQRRDFIALLCGGAAWPFEVRAQQSGSRRIGVLLGNAQEDSSTVDGLAAFAKSMAELGWMEGRNIQIDYRWGAADIDRMQAFAKELVGLKPDLLVAQTTPATAALQKETRTIPILFLIVSDPVGSGFVASLPRPGANITGFINIEGSISGKWIEILKDIVPGVSGAALLYNPDTAPYFEYYRQPFEVAARSSGIEAMPSPVHTAEDIERIVTSVAHRNGVGLVLMPDTFMVTKRNLDLVIALAARYRVPTVYPYRFCVEAGGLISYGTDNADLFRRSATYVDRILKGAKPADLPVQLPTKFDFAVNLKTAKALGLTISAILQATADEVIE
jgi:putative ABC transport system substrate-binding protein